MIETTAQKHLNNMFYENQKKNELKTKKEKRREEKILKKIAKENERVYQLRRKDTLYFSLVAITEIIPHCISVLIEKNAKLRKDEAEFYTNFNHFSKLFARILQFPEIQEIKDRTDFLKYKAIYPEIKEKMESFNMSKKAVLQDNFTLEMMHFSKFLDNACYMFEKKAAIASKKGVKDTNE